MAISPPPIIRNRLCYRGKALGTIKDKRWANVGAIKPAGVVNMVSNLQEDVDFGGLLPIGKNLHVSFLR